MELYNYGKLIGYTFQNYNFFLEQKPGWLQKVKFQLRELKIYKRKKLLTWKSYKVLKKQFLIYHVYYRYNGA